MSFSLYLEFCPSCLVVTKLSTLVADHVLDANLSLFGKSGCLVVAMVSGPPTVVCLTLFDVHQCSRSAVVATCSLSGPSAGTGGSVDTFRLSDIDRTCFSTAFFSSHL